MSGRAKDGPPPMRANIVATVSSPPRPPATSGNGGGRVCGWCRTVTGAGRCANCGAPHVMADHPEPPPPFDPDPRLIGRALR
jgi:hypothetical protein